MRSAGNFSPEWGYLAAAPSFARTARVVLVATAIGATAGAGVVLSLVDRPSEPRKSPVAAPAIVTSVRAAAVPSVAPAAPAVTAAPATVTAPTKPASPSASVAAAPPHDKRDASTHASSRTTPPATAALTRRPLMPPRCRTHPQQLRSRHPHCRSRPLTRIPPLLHLLRRVRQLQRQQHCQRPESRRTSSKLHRRMRRTAPQSSRRSRPRRRKRQSTTPRTLNFPE